MVKPHEDRSKIRPEVKARCPRCQGPTFNAPYSTKPELCATCAKDFEDEAELDAWIAEEEARLLEKP